MHDGVLVVDTFCHPTLSSQIVVVVVVVVVVVPIIIFMLVLLPVLCFCLRTSTIDLPNIPYRYGAFGWDGWMIHTHHRMYVLCM